MPAKFLLVYISPPVLIVKNNSSWMMIWYLPWPSPHKQCMVATKGLCRYIISQNKILSSVKSCYKNLAILLHYTIIGYCTFSTAGISKIISIEGNTSGEENSRMSFYCRGSENQPIMEATCMITESWSKHIQFYYVPSWSKWYKSSTKYIKFSDRMYY